MNRSKVIVLMFLLVLLISGCGVDNVDVDTEPIPDKYLPIGTVVLLTNGDQPIMITARAVEFDGGETRDYSAVLYPYGYLGDEHIYSFNHDDIASVVYMGYESEEDNQVNEFLKESAK